MRNAEGLASLELNVPVLYAGNSAIRQPVRRILEAAGIETVLADNVFPDVDVLNIEPVRRLIHEAFNRHIIHAPGMARLQELTHGGILPTPGAVLRGAELFADALGDCVVFDIGGATSDVHSVTDGSLEWTSKMIEPEPRAKRTVEGDLGVYINARNIVELAGDAVWEARLSDLQAVPRTEQQLELTRWLSARAVEIAVRRHAGVITDLFTATGQRQIVKGKDLTSVKWLVGTGGALTRMPGGEAILRGVCRGPGEYLLPLPEVQVVIDRDYRFSALGTLAQGYPDEVRATFRAWVESAAGRNAGELGRDVHPHSPTRDLHRSDRGKRAHRHPAVPRAWRPSGLCHQGDERPSGDPPSLDAAGADMIADSRITNLQSIANTGLTLPVLLLRVPTPSRVVDVIRCADVLAQLVGRDDRAALPRRPTAEAHAQGDRHGRSGRPARGRLARPRRLGRPRGRPLPQHRDRRPGHEPGLLRRGHADDREHADAGRPS